MASAYTLRELASSLHQDMADLADTLKRQRNGALHTSDMCDELREAQRLLFALARDAVEATHDLDALIRKAGG